MYAFGHWPMRDRYDRSNRMNRREMRARRIFYFKDDDFRSDWQRLNPRQFGLRSFRYLKHIGAIVGEFPEDMWAEYFETNFRGMLYSEPDIQIKIGEPHIGQVLQASNGVPWGVERIDAHRAWPITMGKGVKVAVIDTGIAYDHPGLARNYRGGVNILSPLFSPYDYNGHGTHVAGTVAARKNSTGVVGVAPRAHLYAVKAFNRKGSANLSDLLTAINWCIDNRMDVINMSFGMDKMSESLRRAIQKARSNGIVMVAAAGNQGSHRKLDFPARYPETIAVTATDKNNQLASFSNTGQEVRLAAPGDKITSCWNNGATRELSGTSMAVPHVTGTVALMMSLNPQLTPDDIDAIMTRTCTPIQRVSSGRLGLVNAFNSVQMLSG